MDSARHANGQVASRSAAIDVGVLDDSIGYLLRRAQVTVFQRFFEVFAEVGLRPGQYSVLAVIERNPGLRQTQLGDALGIKKANLVAMIDKLEERGLARRLPAANDRRSHALHLTPRGSALMVRLHRLNSRLDQRFSQVLGTDDRRRLCDALRRISAQNGKPT
ncbi:MAG: MarR family transcriptional regulator [Enhydrobacter sp.]|nr:MAG: MarR family transcriptional regulator [Enhydrobacter sp.]